MIVYKNLQADRRTDPPTARCQAGEQAGRQASKSGSHQGSLLLGHVVRTDANNVGRPLTPLLLLTVIVADVRCRCYRGSPSGDATGKKVRIQEDTGADVVEDDKSKAGN